ncbi:MAG: undecaprenyl-diphosphate phosphatase [Nitrospirae bacterium]|nr:undecaprenyl-diphosphate phosphatase [Candidatus Troglogloeales bacterium]
MIDIFQAVISGIVEGLTEFIPVSSTGHLIIAGHFLGLAGEKTATFEVFIQLGAILAVLFLYKDRFLGLISLKKTENFAGVHGLILLGLTTLPGLIFGALAHSYIKHHLFNLTTVALGLGIGGVIMLLVERRISRQAEGPTHASLKGIDHLSWKDALAIGFFQSLALWPGVSRSGATIVGGIILGVDRKAAAEYSFFAAVPIMCAAVIFDLIRSGPLLQVSDASMFIAGFVVSFVTAMGAISYFIRLLGQVTLTPFGWYRIAMAVFILWGVHGEILK